MDHKTYMWQMLDALSIYDSWQMTIYIEQQPSQKWHQPPHQLQSQQN
jgi:hypothetical protein